ncbi:helicase C-terminal domain-containing protein [Escherichia coli]
MEDVVCAAATRSMRAQLPDAVITLKQGVGRLIRDADDRGVLVICDNRLVMRLRRDVSRQSAARATHP